MATLREEKEKNAGRESVRIGHRSIRGLVVVEDERSGLVREKQGL